MITPEYKKSIAFFDFDGTITTADTLIEMIKYQKGLPALLVGFFLHSPYLLLYKLRIISNQTAKEKIFRFFWRKISEAAFNKLCDDFVTNRLPQLIRPKASVEIEKLIAKDFEIVIVSASPQNWIVKWADRYGASIVATKLEVKNGFLTGKIAGKNCYGLEKVARINCEFNLETYNEVLAYGDTPGDLPMLYLAQTRFYKPFR